MAGKCLRIILVCFSSEISPDVFFDFHCFPFVVFLSVSAEQRNQWISQGVQVPQEHSQEITTATSYQESQQKYASHDARPVTSIKMNNDTGMIWLQSVLDSWWFDFRLEVSRSSRVCFVIYQPQIVLQWFHRWAKPSTPTVTIHWQDLGHVIVCHQTDWLIFMGFNLLNTSDSANKR